MDDEALIKCVRRHDFLYDPGSKRHADVRLVKTTWEDIARTVHSSTSECKKRWTSLRDQFRRNVVKRLRAAGAEGASNRVKWRYEDQMSFLIPHMKERPQKPSSARSQDAAASDDNGSNQSFGYSTTHSHDSHQLSSPSSTPSVSPVPSLLGSDDEQPDPPSKKRIKTRHQLTPADMLQNYLKSKRPNRSERPMDHIGAFFLSMETSVRRLPPLLQIEAKGKIGALVSALEMRAYASDQGSSAGMVVPVNFAASVPSRAVHDVSNPRTIGESAVGHCTTTSSILPDDAPLSDSDDHDGFID